MFDVLWTDPNRELVGERLMRKEREEREGRAKDKDRRKQDNGRHSVSTSSSSSSERGFGFFAGKGRKKTVVPSKSDHLVASPTEPTLDDTKDMSIPAYGVRTLLSHEDNSVVTVKPTNGELPSQLPENADGCSCLSSLGTGRPQSRCCLRMITDMQHLESVISKWTQPSLATSSTLTGSSPRSSVATKSEHLIQTLGPSSFVIKTTQVVVSPRTLETDIDHLISEVHISSDRIKAETPPLPDLPEEGAPLPFDDDTDSILIPTQLSRTPPPMEFGNNAVMHTPGWNNSEQLGNHDAWKPPDEWDCTSTRDKPTPTFEERIQGLPANSDNTHYMSPDLSALQREVRMMAAASPDLILANMKAGMGDAPDAMIYKELEMTKKRWMFSALHQNEGYADLDRCSFSPGVHAPSRRPRILAIYETQTSASFLAALHPNVTISHLSPHPIDPGLFPNIQPILVPAVSATAASRPLPPQLFSSVTCLSMPALFPSAEVPPFLRHVNRCLTPGGALHLTLIDPEPVSTSMGPRLRQWLIEKLLINLEQSFRTTLPSRTFPAWLAVSRLRGKGSTIATISLAAVPEGLAKIEGVRAQSPVQIELRCLVMRMLWQEVWGSFVHADRWWWEEEEIIQECIELGTYWKYSHIVAVKEDT
ncbi:hypothetical protein BJ170DRAFT_586116 [Xylariales sp. AK1849]|nr:hypothetical protein BJ170DRAFT_586116 [Xylariales sp. AK1849]